MSDLEARALRAAQQEDATRSRDEVAAARAKEEADERLRVQLAEKAVASVQAALGVQTSPSDWKLCWAWSRNGYGDDQYPLVQLEIDGVLVNCKADGSGELIANAYGVGNRFYEFSLAGFGRALQFKQDMALMNCRYCAELVRQSKLASHEADCYRILPWHKKLLHR